MSVDVYQTVGIFCREIKMKKRKVSDREKYKILKEVILDKFFDVSGVSSKDLEGWVKERIKEKEKKK